MSESEAAQRHELWRMKTLATSLLVLAAVVFVVASAFEGDRPALGYVRATAEAAMVGAIADWFAVVALFKHPLGLPIPHTALVPQRKDEIGKGLGEFVQTNFLSEKVISQKLESMDLSRRIALWLREPENARLVIHELAVPVTSVAEVLRNDVQALVDTVVRHRVVETSVAPVAGRVLGAVMTLLREADADHHVPGDVDVRALDLVDRLRTDERLAAKGEQLKHELLDHPEFAAWISELWESFEHGLGDLTETADSAVRRRVEGAIIVLANQLLHDESLQAKVDSWIETVVVSVADAGSSEIGELIEETVKGWDNDQLIDRLEPPIGCDLQFIRINGTLVGGLVGFVIFAVNDLFF